MKNYQNGITQFALNIGDQKYDVIFLHPLTRYGSTTNQYNYSKGDPFTVTQTTTKYSSITITLHPVIGGNYQTHPITAEDFEKASGVNPNVDIMEDVFASDFQQPILDNLDKDVLVNIFVDNDNMFVDQQVIKISLETESMQAVVQNNSNKYGNKYRNLWLIIRVFKEDQLLRTLSPTSYYGIRKNENFTFNLWTWFREQSLDELGSIYEVIVYDIENIKAKYGKLDAAQSTQDAAQFTQLVAQLDNEEIIKKILQLDRKGSSLLLT